MKKRKRGSMLASQTAQQAGASTELVRLAVAGRQLARLSLVVAVALVAAAAGGVVVEAEVVEHVKSDGLSPGRLSVKGVAAAAAVVVAEHDVVKGRADGGRGGFRSRAIVVPQTVASGRRAVVGVGACNDAAT